jgi:AcrR family transcriptional regulator
METTKRDPAETAKTRRTEGVHTMGRAARVVDAVLRATAAEVARVGYAALRVDEIAALSGVNKTTIYRRWPTKGELVVAALRLAKVPPGHDTGDLRADVIAWLRQTMEFAVSPLGSGIIRVMQSERGQPEIDAIARTLRAEQRAARKELVERAIARGELPRGADASLIGDLLFMPILSRLVNHGERVSDAYVESAVDLVLAGARAQKPDVASSPPSRRVPVRGRSAPASGRGRRTAR